MKKIAFFVLTVVVMTGCNQGNAVKTGMEGKTMPSFALRLADSTSFFNTASIPAGKPSVLFLFSPFCPYCRAEMDGIIDNMQELKDVHFYLLTPWPFHDMKLFYAYYHLEKYPNLTVGVDTSNFFGKYIHAQGVPYTAFYGKDKKLDKVFVGKTDAGIIEDEAGD
jgi:thiol-disulfide isomerase/thioredoxin